jgi:hypothetical protein
MYKMYIKKNRRKVFACLAKLSLFVDGLYIDLTIIPPLMCGVLAALRMGIGISSRTHFKLCVPASPLSTVGRGVGWMSWHMCGLEGGVVWCY